MDSIQTIVLGIVQGITEWVPISSKTQDAFVYLSLFKGDPTFLVSILLWLHIGTLLAATIYFRKEILLIFHDFLKQPLNFQSHANGTIGFLFTALLCTGIVGLPLLLIEKKFLPTLNASMLFALMGVGLLITGVLLFNQKGKNVYKEKKQVTWKDGVLTGVLQGLSILPGVSRSGTSTTGLIWRGFNAESSFYLSFLLSIPTVLCAELIFYLGGETLVFPIVDGILLALVSFIVGYLTIGAILKIVKKVNLAYVAFVLGALIIGAALFGLA